MSEQFESGLNELYTRAAAAHASGTGFPTTALVATARRHRRVRAAAVSMATVAAVVGVGFGGAAAVRTFADGAPVGPALSGSPIPTAGPTDTVLTCGSPIASLLVSEPASLTVEAVVGTPTVTGAVPLQGSLVITGNGASRLADEGAVTMRYLAIQDGVVVGIGQETGDAPVVGLFGRDGVAHEFAVAWAGCDENGQTTVELPPGEYDLYVSVTTLDAVVTGVADQGTESDLVVAEGVALGGPWPFTVTDTADPSSPTATPDATTDTPRPPEQLGVDGVSATFTEGEPLADGDYIGHLQGVDAAAGTIDVDLAVWYTGQAAEDYIAATDPGAELLDDYYIADDSPLVTTLPVTADARVWEWCFDPTDASPFGYFLRTVDEWAAAPTSSSLDVAPTQCADGANLLRGTLYWFQVSGGVVTQVIGQYVP